MRLAGYCQDIAASLFCGSGNEVGKPSSPGMRTISVRYGENKICKRCSFECGIGKYSTRPRNKVWAFRQTPYSLDMCCIFQYRTKMNNTVCIFSHDCPKFSTAQRSVQLTDMTDDHKTRRRSVNSIHRSPAIQHAYTCIHVVQRSAVSADPDIRLIDWGVSLEANWLFAGQVLYFLISHVVYQA